MLLNYLYSELSGAEKDSSEHKKATKVNDSEIKYYVLIYRVCDKSKKLEVKRIHD